MTAVHFEFRRVNDFMIEKAKDLQRRYCPDPGKYQSAITDGFIVVIPRVTRICCWIYSLRASKNRLKAS